MSLIFFLHWYIGYLETKSEPSSSKTEQTGALDVTVVGAVFHEIAGCCCVARKTQCRKRGSSWNAWKHFVNTYCKKVPVLKPLNSFEKWKTIVWQKCLTHLPHKPKYPTFLIKIKPKRPWFRQFSSDFDVQNTVIYCLGVEESISAVKSKVKLMV